MRKYKYIIFSLCFSVFAVITTSCIAQTDSSFTLLKTISGNFSYLNVDNLDNIYLITESNQLKKTNINGDSLAIFNDVKRFGNPSYIDVSNPLKILLYYSKFSTTVILDRFLNIRNTINFRKQNIFLVNAVATSYDNNIWLFDEQNYSLKKISETGLTQQESSDWRTFFDTMPSPTQILDRNNFVYLYDSLKGFYVFDYYGSFKNKLPFTNWQFTEISGDYLYGFAQNKMYSYHLKTLELKEYVLPNFFTNYSSVKAMNGKVYLLKPDCVEVYEVK
ncbi:MAG: hypothetical protein IPP48_08710 [Chitinophagaceae bacterium]|nr:hypothetical protein [Chitinophagaceae bacterium]